jgi:hypothetical protein
VRRWYDKICTWGVDCLSHSRFCPNPDGGGFSEYLSGDGDVDGGVENPGMFRLPDRHNRWADQNDHLTAHKNIAKRIWDRFGDQLGPACALSLESLVPGVEDILKSVNIKLDQMLGINIEPQRIFDFFGLSQQMAFSPIASAAMNQRHSVHPIGVRAAWMRDGRECASYGLGFSLPKLLVLGSFIGDSLKDRFHTAIIENLSRALVQQLMLRAPPSITVSKRIAVTSFKCFTCELEHVSLEGDTKRPNHIQRPRSDLTGVTGEISLCGPIGKWAPEDIAHNSVLLGWEKTLGLPDILSVPASTEVCYYLEEDRVYCIYNQSSGCLGTLMLNDSGAAFEAETSRGSADRTGRTFLPLSWPTDLAHEGFIILPMIRRSGACVRAGEHGVACLVKNGEDNFSAVDFSYRALKRFEWTEPMHALAVMQDLLPLGTKLVIKCDAHAAGPLLSRLSMPLSIPQLPLFGIRCFLNAPTVMEPEDGRVYVAICVQTEDGLLSEDLVVDPWDLALPECGRTMIDTVKARAPVRRRA